MDLGAPEIGLIILGFLLLFGYKKLPDASRSLGRSLRIFKGEMKGMKDDDVPDPDPAATSPVRGEIVASRAASTPLVDSADELLAEARAAEARAAELRALAARARTADVPN